MLGSTVKAADFLLERSADRLSGRPVSIGTMTRVGDRITRRPTPVTPPMMRYLLDKGANPEAKDCNWNDSPRAWAEGRWTCHEVKGIIGEFESTELQE